MSGAARCVVCLEPVYRVKAAACLDPLVCLSCSLGENGRFMAKRAEREVASADQSA